MEMKLCPYPKSRKDIPANGIRIICEPSLPVSAPMLRRILRNTARKKGTSCTSEVKRLIEAALEEWYKELEDREKNGKE